MTFRKLIMTGVCAGFLVATLPPSARASTDAQNLVDQARVTLDDVKKDKEFGNAPDLLHRAKAVMIVPALFKGGFFVGGEGGTGVVMTRDAGGHWSYPAFYTLVSASFGLQIGAEQSELVLIALTDRARRAFLQDEFKIGAEAGLAVVTLGASAEAASASNLKADIVVWTSSSGAYAGLTLNGSVIKPRQRYNEEYYGRAVGPTEIESGSSVRNHGADRLRHALGAMS